MEYLEDGEYEKVANIKEIGVRGCSYIKKVVRPSTYERYTHQMLYQAMVRNKDEL